MTNQSITRIQRISKRFRMLFTALIFFIPLADLLFWISFNHLHDEFLTGLPIIPSQDPTPLFLALGFLVSLIPVTVAIYGMLTLSRLFKFYEYGIVFAHENVRLIRKLGYVIIAWVVANLFFTPLISAVITHGNEGGLPTIAVSLSISDLSALVMGSIVVLISWVMDEGRKLQDEQAHTV
jgi:hypothetical protein